MVDFPLAFLLLDYLKYPAVSMIHCFLVILWLVYLIPSLLPFSLQSKTTPPLVASFHKSIWYPCIITSCQHDLQKLASSSFATIIIILHFLLFCFTHVFVLFFFCIYLDCFFPSYAGILQILSRLISGSYRCDGNDQHAFQDFCLDLIERRIKYHLFFFLTPSWIAISLTGFTCAVRDRLCDWVMSREHVSLSLFYCLSYRSVSKRPTSDIGHSILVSLIYSSSGIFGCFVFRSATLALL